MITEIDPGTPEPEWHYERALRLPDGTLVSPNAVWDLPRWIQVRLGMLDPDAGMLGQSEYTWTVVRRRVTVICGEWEPDDAPQTMVTSSRYSVEDVWPSHAG